MIPFGSFKIFPSPGCPQISLSHHLQTRSHLAKASRVGVTQSRNVLTSSPCVRTCLHCWNSLAQLWRMFSLSLHRWPVPTLTLTLSCPLPQRLPPWDSARL